MLAQNERSLEEVGEPLQDRLKRGARLARPHHADIELGEYPPLRRHRVCQRSTCADALDEKAEAFLLRLFLDKLLEDDQRLVEGEAGS